MAFSLSGEEVAKRLKEIIDERFDKSIPAFAQACNVVDGREGADYYSTVQKYLGRKSMPKLDTAAILAQAAGVSIEWLAGIEKPRSTNGTGAGEERFEDSETKLVNPYGMPASEAAKVEAGYFYFGSRRIKASMLFESDGPPGDLGGFEPE